MNKENLFVVSLCFLLVFMVLIYCGNSNMNNEDINKKFISSCSVDTIILAQPEFLLEYTPNTNNVYKALEHYNIQHPDIVYAQAVLETGNFKSRICKEYNNLFGLYNSHINDYYKFNHWSESIIGYADYIQYKYDSTYNNDYYLFLTSIGYAEDTNYINKLKILVKQHDKKGIAKPCTFINETK